MKAFALAVIIGFATFGYFFYSIYREPADLWLTSILNQIQQEYSQLIERMR
jgi:hypothetical protein